MSTNDREVISHPPTATSNVTGGAGTSGTGDKGLAYGGTSGDAYLQPSEISTGAWGARLIWGILLLILVLGLLWVFV